MLWEVDTGFVIWYRAEKYGESVEKMFNDAIKKYTKFIDELTAFGNIIVISTPLPTITDDNDWGEIANLRKEVKATQLQRTELTLKFNKNIEYFCNKNDISFINLDNDSLGENGLVKKELLNKSKFNHHYNKITYSRLIISKIRNILKWTYSYCLMKTIMVHI